MKNIRVVQVDITIEYIVQEQIQTQILIKS